MTEDVYEVFISYNRQDGPVAQEVYKELYKRGIRPYIDVENIEPGEDWQAALAEAARLCSTALVLVGPTGLGRMQTLEVAMLIHYYTKGEMKVIPIRLPEAELSGPLVGLQWVDLTENGIPAAMDRIFSGLVQKTPRTRKLPFFTLGELFQGREKEMQQLAARLADRGPATADVQYLVIHGLGGIGKTRLAVEYALRHRDLYTSCFYVQAQSPEGLRTGLAQLAAPMLRNSSHRDGRSEVDDVESVLGWLRENPGWLLILDDASSPKAVDAVGELLLELSGGQVLITSRVAIGPWPPGNPEFPLETIAEDDAVRFLLARTKKRPQTPSDNALARRLAQTLDNLPLALEQAGAYINVQLMTFEQYLDAWTREDERWEALAEEQPEGLSRPIVVTFQNTLKELNAAPIALLRLVAFLSPEPIPISLLEKGTAKLAEAAQRVAAEAGGTVAPATLRRPLAPLAAFSMVRWTGGETFTVHRMVQEAMRLSIPRDQRGTWIALALEIVQLSLPPDPDDVHNWPAWDRLRPHVAQIIEHAADRVDLSEPVILLMNELATLLRAKGLLIQAEPLARRSLQISEKSLGDDHPEVALRLNNLAALLLDTSQPGEAEPLLHRALRIDEACHPDGLHPTISRDLHNLATALSRCDRNADAEPLLRRALDIDEKCSGPVHHDISRDLNSLGLLLREAHRYEEAEKHMRRALETDEKCFGETHPKIARDLSNLAELLRKTDRRTAAEEPIRRALEIDQHYFGSSHPAVARDLHYLAQFLQETGRLAEAEKMMRRAFVIDKVFFGREHPTVALDLNDLALLRKDLDQCGAEPLLGRALGILERRLGPEHPQTRIVRANLQTLRESTVASQPRSA